MPQGPDGKTIIIVKKSGGHGGGHHGGSWKVAYADFVTSMMAFFMVLWLVNTASVVTRERIANYFRKPGVFLRGSGTPLELGGAGILPDTFAPPAQANSQVMPNKRMYEVVTEQGALREAFGRGEGKGEAAEDKASLERANAAVAEGEQLKKVAEQIKGVVERDRQSVGGLLGKVMVNVDQRGLHLEIMDTPTASMFERGSALILPGAGEELNRIARLLTSLPNPIDIEGHTDAVPFSDAMQHRYDNWDLSLDRANAARRALLAAGLKESQISRVVGYAAQRPKVVGQPLHPSNRRISISMRYTEQAAVILRGTQVRETRSAPVRRPGDTPSTAPIDQAPTQGDKLDLEITTTPPEGTPLLDSTTAPDEAPPKPSFMRDDKIFTDTDSFFGVAP